MTRRWTLECWLLNKCAMWFSPLFDIRTVVLVIDTDLVEKSKTRRFHRQNQYLISSQEDSIPQTDAPDSVVRDAPGSATLSPTSSRLTSSSSGIESPQRLFPLEGILANIGRQALDLAEPWQDAKQGQTLPSHEFGPLFGNRTPLH